VIVVNPISNVVSLVEVRAMRESEKIEVGRIVMQGAFWSTVMLSPGYSKAL